ncbi:MAG: metalloregulator ArsR/SmtB family transcription factor [Anaerolineae bacterium]|nr:metalloregulator ArsR/SmtB family transcription factor [Anaerolineae bacterium]
MGQEDFDRLLAFFKVMGNENRLKIAGMLAEGEHTVTELADRLDLREPTVSEHLAMMREIGLVRMRPEGTRRVYSFNFKALYAMNKDILSREKLAELVRTKPEDEEQRILRTYIRDGRLTQIPVGRKKLLTILKFLSGQFAFETRYPEKQVNEILGKFNEDYATLRRELVDFHYLEREKGIYWRVERGEEQ